MGIAISPTNRTIETKRIVGLTCSTLLMPMIRCQLGATVVIECCLVPRCVNGSPKANTTWLSIEVPPTVPGHGHFVEVMVAWLNCSCPQSIDPH